MDYLADSIEKARLEASEVDFNTCCGGSYEEDEEQQTEE